MKKHKYLKVHETRIDYCTIVSFEVTEDKKEKGLYIKLEEVK